MTAILVLCFVFKRVVEGVWWNRFGSGGPFVSFADSLFHS